MFYINNQYTANYCRLRYFLIQKDDNCSDFYRYYDSKPMFRTDYNSKPIFRTDYDSKPMFRTDYNSKPMFRTDYNS